MSKVIIVGGGAGGLMAGIHAAEKGHQVLLLEKNEKVGKKLFITGKGRCNLTNQCQRDDFFDAVVTNPRFLFSAYAGWSCQDTMRFFEELGVPLKVERGGRVPSEPDDEAADLRPARHDRDRAGQPAHARTRRVLLFGAVPRR